MSRKKLEEADRESSLFVVLRIITLLIQTADILSAHVNSDFLYGDYPSSDINFKCLIRAVVLTNSKNNSMLLKNILNLEGAQKLTINEQKNIKGSGPGEFTVCCPNDNDISYPDCTYIECLS